MTDSDIAAFEEFVSDENMRLAWKRMTHSMRKEVKDWLGLQAYAPQIETHIKILQESLRSDFTPSREYPFYKTKQDRSLRRFSFLSVDDRFVYQAICNILVKNSYDRIIGLSKSRRLFSNIPTNPLLNNEYTFRRTFTSRFGTHEGQYDKYRRQVLQSRKEFLAEYPNSWVVRTDVRSYFPSIDHCELLSLLECKQWLPDEGMRNVLKRCLAMWQYQAGKGIPIGYECSDLIGNLFLIPLDKRLSEFTVHRYVDDMYIFTEDFEQAKQAIYLVDEVLTKRLLQRNTLKTEFLSLSELCEDELRRRLTESLSQLAREQPEEESENDRQRQLLGVLHGEFGTDFEKLNLCGKLDNISRSAFVLYRLRDPDDSVRRLAYYVLDHYPDYAFHAMTYLFRAYNTDPELESKLATMIEAEYEANDVKGNAVRYLSVTDGGQKSADYVAEFFSYSETDDWHLLYVTIRDVVARKSSQCFYTLLNDATCTCNPFIASYAAVQVFSSLDADRRVELVNRLICKESYYEMKIGLYLAYRFRVKVDPSHVPCELEELVDEERMKEKLDFHSAIKELFHIPLSKDFPIQTYFGDLGNVNQILSDIKLHRSQGIKPYLDAVNDLLSVFFGNWSKLYDRCAFEERDGYPDDDKLTTLLHNVQPKPDGQYKWKDGKQEYLIGELRPVFQKYLKDVEMKENITVREEVFICYARIDSAWKDRVRTHMRPYENYFDITVWSDDKIKPGEDWDQEIKLALGRAKVAVLLETPEFLDSNYIHNEELPEILLSSQTDGLKIRRFPISSSAVDITPLGKIEAAWDTSKMLKGILEDGKSEIVNKILKTACREIALTVSESFRQSQTAPE